MRIAEIFHSIQGEGSLTGLPSVFVRASGCNLRCRWCDTPYASWSPEGRETDVATILAAVRGHGVPHVVLTGGEPMIAKDIHALASALRADGRHLTIETAGTIPPGGIACDLASLSPKLGNSAPANDDPRGPGWRDRHESVRRQPGVVRAWIEEAQASGADFQLKFVVDSADDMAEVDAWLEDIGIPVPPHKVFLMPEGVTIESLRARGAWLAGLCARRGFRYAHRLQIELFGNIRGT